jgi:hypothetical protein
MATHVKWLGDLIAERAIAAIKLAIDEVTHAAAEDAQQSHWWRSRSGELERNTFSEPAVAHARGHRARTFRQFSAARGLLRPVP